jgi:hypothetical protein
VVVGGAVDNVPGDVDVLLCARTAERRKEERERPTANMMGCWWFKEEMPVLYTASLRR